MPSTDVSALPLPALCCRWNVAQRDERLLYNHLIRLLEGITVDQVQQNLSMLKNWRMTSLLTLHQSYPVNITKSLQCTWDPRIIVDANTGGSLLHIHLLKCTEPQISMVEFLLHDCGISPNTRDLLGRTPLHILCRYWATKIERYPVLVDIAQCMMRYKGDPLLLDYGGYSCIDLLVKFHNRSSKSLASLTPSASAPSKNEHKDETAPPSSLLQPVSNLLKLLHLFNQYRKQEIQQYVETILQEEEEEVQHIPHNDANPPQPLSTAIPHETSSSSSSIVCATTSVPQYPDNIHSSISVPLPPSSTTTFHGTLSSPFASLSSSSSFLSSSSPSSSSSLSLSSSRAYLGGSDPLTPVRKLSLGVPILSSSNNETSTENRNLFSPPIPSNSSFVTLSHHDSIRPVQHYAVILVDHRPPVPRSSSVSSSTSSSAAFPSSIHRLPPRIEHRQLYPSIGSSFMEDSHIKALQYSVEPESGYVVALAIGPFCTNPVQPNVTVWTHCLNAVKMWRNAAIAMLEARICLARCDDTNDSNVSHTLTVCPHKSGEGFCEFSLTVWAKLAVTGTIPNDVSLQKDCVRIHSILMKRQQTPKHSKSAWTLPYLLPSMFQPVIPPFHHSDKWGGIRNLPNEQSVWKETIYVNGNVEKETIVSQESVPETFNDGTGLVRNASSSSLTVPLDTGISLSSWLYQLHQGPSSGSLSRTPSKALLIPMHRASSLRRLPTSPSFIPSSTMRSIVSTYSPDKDRSGPPNVSPVQSYGRRSSTTPSEPRENGPVIATLSPVARNLTTHQPKDEEEDNDEEDDDTAEIIDHIGNLHL